MQVRLAGGKLRTRSRACRCLTYGNDPLASDEHFRVLKAEFWGFAPAVHSPLHLPTSPVSTPRGSQPRSVEASPSMQGSILPEAHLYGTRETEPPEIADRRQGSFQALVAGVLTPMIGGRGRFA